MPPRRVTASAVDATGQLIYTVEHRPRPGAPPLCGVLVVLDAEERRAQPRQLEATPADPTDAESLPPSSRPAPGSTPAPPE